VVVGRTVIGSEVNLPGHCGRCRRGRDRGGRRCDSCQSPGRLV